MQLLVWTHCVSVEEVNNITCAGADTFLPSDADIHPTAFFFYYKEK